MLCSLAFDGGILEAVVGMLNRASKAKHAKAKEDDKKNDSSSDDEDECDSDGCDSDGTEGVSSTHCRLAPKPDAMNSEEMHKEAAKRILLNILEADRPRKANRVPPAFLRACCLGWLRRSPGVLVGGARDATLQRISLLMISRALEFAGSKVIFEGDEKESRKGSVGGERAAEVLRGESVWVSAPNVGVVSDAVNITAHANRFACHSWKCGQFNTTGEGEKEDEYRQWTCGRGDGEREKSGYDEKGHYQAAEEQGVHDELYHYFWVHQCNSAHSRSLRPPST